MAQVSLYLEESLLKRLEERAKQDRLSLSAWVRLRLEESLAQGWPADFIEAYGSLAALEGFERPATPGFELDSPRESFE